MREEVVHELDGKVASVMGAASGIGAAIALELGRQGATVECADIDEVGAEKTAQAIRAEGGQAHSGYVDVRSSAMVADVFEGARHSHGQLDIAVGTPGINIRKPMMTYSDDDYNAVVDVNLRGVFNVMRGAGRLMVGQRSGSILVISSISCRVAEPGQVAYAGTKAAVAQMVRVAAAEFGPFGVRVNAIAPGPVETALTDPIRQDPEWAKVYALRTALRRWAQPEEMAAPAAFLLSDRASYVTGTVMFVDGGSVDIEREFADPHLVAANGAGQ